ncbi:MAG: MBL fold metallo-hydrolase, partial [Elusimicrobiota bacterium]
WPFFANHPSTTLGYLLEIGGKRVVYCPDAELYGETASALQDYDEKTGRICRGADLLIHDARYTDEDHASHLNEGHSSVSIAAGFAADNEVRRLLLFHADPSYGEEQADAMTTRAREVLEERGAVIPCDRAKEGLRLEI